MQALSLAGGLLTPFAGKDEIKILRRDAAGKQSMILFDYSELEDGENPRPISMLKGGDVVVACKFGFGF